MIRALTVRCVRKGLLSSSSRRGPSTTRPSASPASSVAIANDHEHSVSWMLFYAAAAAGVATCATPSTRLEGEASDAVHDDGEEDNEHRASEDPYDNLPEEDGPTHCSICMTYRQGPCRPYWRKVEACTKDNELKKQQSSPDDGEATGENAAGDDGEQEAFPDTPCLKYMLPWIDCATGFRNLYNLIELDTNYAAGILDLEEQAVETLCWAPSVQPKVDWTAWQVYVLAHEDWKLPPKKKKTSKKDSEDEDSVTQKVSLWKTLDQSKDPEVVEVETVVPNKQGSGVLECTYALDQDGNVLGFSYGTRPSEAFKEPEESKEDADGETSDTTELKIRLLPKKTRSIVIKASYTQPHNEGAKEDDPFEAHIYQSKRFSLKKMAREG
mmetsp:Transcript_97433/g.146020  ORF Transcript_97433/g.146020 Transcript_97433/m.146020 type:complete len:383 (-) Transcript_97433:10-1158(-)